MNKYVLKIQLIKVVRILKKRSQEMSHSSKVLRTFEFLRIFGAAEKIQAKVEANCTGFSAEFFGFQSVEMLFCQENKNSNVVNFLPELDISGALFSYILMTLRFYEIVVALLKQCNFR